MPTGCPAHQEAARRQPERDRHPRLSFRPRTRHPATARHLCPGRSLRPAHRFKKRDRGLSAVGQAWRAASKSVPRHSPASSPRRKSTTSTRSIPATASSRRIRALRRRYVPRRRQGSSSGRTSASSKTSATRSRPARSPISPRCRSSRAAAIPSPIARPRRRSLAKKLGYPVIVKASDGRRPGYAGRPAGSQRRQRLENRLQLREVIPCSASPGRLPRKAAAGRRPYRGIQFLGDLHGNLIHLFELHCSLQRRHQKASNRSPSPNLLETAGRGRRSGTPRIKAARRPGSTMRGPSSSSDDVDDQEVLPSSSRSTLASRSSTRSPSKSPATTSFASRSSIASENPLNGPTIAMQAPQDEIRTYGFAVQCRVTSEDPANKFIPDYGRLSHYRTAGGPGIRPRRRLRVHRWSTRRLLRFAAGEGDRPRHPLRGSPSAGWSGALQEFRIRGVKTNIPFLINLVNHPAFKTGGVTTRFLDDTPGSLQARRSARTGRRSAATYGPPTSS